jgi:predicted transcriptional regulator
MSPTKQLGIRLDETIVARLERLAEVLAAKVPGLASDVSIAHRAALVRGLESLEAEYKIKR